MSVQTLPNQTQLQLEHTVRRQQDHLQEEIEALRGKNEEMTQKWEERRENSEKMKESRALTEVFVPLRVHY